MARQVWKWEPTGRWIRGVLADETVVDSKRAHLMIESPGELDYYFPPEDVRAGALEPSDHVETSGYRGARRFWHLRLGDRLIENAAWTYDARENRPDFGGAIAFKWGVMDHWYEEAEEIFYHPRNPYHRVDYIPSSRRVEVLVDGVKVADSAKPLLVFETSLPTRYYLPEEDVDMRFLKPVDAKTYCPYKGAASYYDVVVNSVTYGGAAWYYPQPVPEAPRLKGTIAFWPEQDKRIELLVDGDSS